MIENKSCEGCRTYIASIENHGIQCASIKYNTNGRCPCMRCIIKMVCYTTCDDFFHFRIERKEVGGDV